MLTVDPHLHLGGCFSTHFIWDVIKERGLKHLAESYKDVKAEMQFGPTEEYGFHRFLDKFRILDDIPWDEELISRSIQDVSTRLVDYSWMRFSINKYMNRMNWHKREAVSYIYDEFKQHAPGKVGLILAIKYESERAGQRQYAKLLDECSDQLIGIDLVGDEGEFDANFYAGLLADWRSAGKVVCAHVGESTMENQGPINVKKAITKLKVNHVAHGIYAWPHDDILDLAKELDVTFDMALSSNYMTGVWKNKSWHPIMRFLEAGVKVTIGTDDPTQCGDTTLDREFSIMKALGASEAQISKLKQTANDNTLPFLDGVKDTIIIR